MTELGLTRFQIHPSKVAVFCGPTIPTKEIHKILPGAMVLPPIGRGQLPKVVRSKAQVVAIVDGASVGQPTVSTDEILEALNEGVSVYGASGLGALRALELRQHGMQGIGTIYDWYRRGVTFRDDEVLGSDPLINLRYAAQVAVQEGIVTRKFGERAIRQYAKFFYQDRRYSSLFEQLGDKGEARKFQSFVRTNKRSLDLKFQDATQLLQHLKKSFLIKNDYR